jgi:hypothetical protein
MRILWRRLLRTLQALYLITYGRKQEAERAGEAVKSYQLSSGCRLIVGA